MRVWCHNVPPKHTYRRKSNLAIQVSSDILTLLVKIVYRAITHQNGNPTNNKYLRVNKVLYIKLVNLEEDYINLWPEKHTRSERTWLRHQGTKVSS